MSEISKLLMPGENLMELNPYLVKYLELQEEHPYSWRMADHALVILRGIKHQEARSEWVTKYAFSIPDGEAIEALLPYSPFVSIGAGPGYWERLLSDAGAKVDAYDRAPRDKTWYSVAFGDHRKVSNYPSDWNLILNWPPYVMDDPYGESDSIDTLLKRKEVDCSYEDIERLCSLGSLRLWKGRFLIYIGEQGGCTGSREFHDYLDQHFSDWLTIKIPQWYGLHDSVHIYARNGWRE